MWTAAVMSVAALAVVLGLMALREGAERQPKVRESHGHLVRARSRPHGWCFVRIPTWGSLAACRTRLPVIESASLSGSGDPQS